MIIRNMQSTLSRIAQIETNLKRLAVEVKPKKHPPQKPVFQKLLRREIEATAQGLGKANRSSGKGLSSVIAQASEKYGVPQALIRAVIKTESDFQVYAKSPKGALGLMQLMPETARALKVDNPFDPKQNVEGGTKYLSELLKRYDNDLIKALAAYNAGPSRVDQEGVPAIVETQNYIKKVIKHYHELNA